MYHFIIIKMEKNDGSFMCSSHIKTLSLWLVITAILYRICIFNVRLFPCENFYHEWYLANVLYSSSFHAEFQEAIQLSLHLILSHTEAWTCTLFYLGEEYNNLGFVKERRGYCLLEGGALRGTSNDCIVDTFLCVW